MNGTIRRAILAIAAMALVATAVAGGVLAATSAKTYTGCLTTNGGTLILIKEGQSPQKPCPAGTVQVRLGEGDITAVTAGTGLAGGGASGDVSLSIATAFRLPQGCGAGKIAKWDGDSWECADDANTTYTAGTGLALKGSELSVAEPYQMPQGCEWGESPKLTNQGTWGCVQAVHAEQACSAGQFVRAADADGDLTCATPAGGGSTTYVSESPGDWSLGTDEDTEVAKLSPGAGTRFMIAKGTIDINDDATDFDTIECRLFVDASEIDSVVLDEDTIDQGGRVPFTLTGAAPMTSSFSVRCVSSVGGTNVTNIRLIGVKLTS